MTNIENLVFMQTEDNMVSLERADGTVIIYPASLIPSCYHEGHIIKSIVHSEDFIEFVELNVAEMEARHARISSRVARIRARAMRSTENNVDTSEN
ncbi:MAG: hypothetical protein IJW20_05775 [Clostridia bacterium]|nr:hypothetical protein [Clostridia bacterium]